jgi:hypothetical protein
LQQLTPLRILYGCSVLALSRAVELISRPGQVDVLDAPATTIQNGDCKKNNSRSALFLDVQSNKH